MPHERLSSRLSHCREHVQLSGKQGWLL